MPRLVNSVPRYRKHRASGQAVVTLDGCDHYLGPHGTKTSKLAYDRLIAEWLANGRRIEQPAAEITVVEVIARYRLYAKAYYRKNGKCTGVYPGIASALRYLKTWYGKEPAVEVGPVRLKALRERMVADGLSRRYVNDHVDRIKRMYKWAAAEQIIPESAYRQLALLEGLRKGRSAAREAAPILPVDDAIVDSTLPHLPPVVRSMVELQRATGMRPAEVCIMRPCDVDRSGDIWVYRPQSHKTEHHGRVRTVTLGPKAQGILLRYLARNAEAYCFQPRDSEAKRLAEKHANRKTRMSCGNRPGTNRARSRKRRPGKVYTTATYRRAITRGCDKAFPATEGTKGAELAAWRESHRWAPNRLRHSFATDVRRQFGLEHAQVALGHASARVTEVYAERDLAKAAEVARQIG